MDSIIFDLDGTLWDSRESVAIAWNKAAEQVHLNREITTDDLKRVMGLQMEDATSNLLHDTDEAVRNSFIKACNYFEKQVLSEMGGVLYEDVESVLKDLSNRYRLFIVSNCQDGYIEAFYEYHKLECYFQDYENPGRTGLSKGENIKLVMERNDLLSPVYVGDTEGDRTAAVDAGIPFVYAAYGFGEVVDYSKKIATFPDLRREFL